MTNKFSSVFKKFGLVLSKVLSISAVALFPLKHLTPRNRKIAIISAFIVILVMIPIVIYTLSHLGVAEAAWFDQNFGFRQRIDITNSGSAQTDFQISFTLNTDTLYDNGKLRADCADINRCERKTFAVLD